MVQSTFDIHRPSNWEVGKAPVRGFARSSFSRSLGSFFIMT